MNVNTIVTISISIKDNLSRVIFPTEHSLNLLMLTEKMISTKQDVYSIIKQILRQEQEKETNYEKNTIYKYENSCVFKW